MPESKHPPAPLPEETQRTIRASIGDGACHAIMLGAGENYLGPFAVFLKASVLQVGALATVPPFIAAACQLLCLRFLPRIRSRKNVLAAAAALNAAMWLPMAAIPLIVEDGRHAVDILFVFAAIFFGSAGFMGPLWNSLIGDLIPPGMRGAVLGKRNKYNGIGTFISLFAAGQLLGVFEKEGLSKWGFVTIFVTAFFARMGSAYWLSRYGDLVYHHKADERFTFIDFLKTAFHSNFGRFVLFNSIINFGIAFAGPYFMVYMLRELKFSFAQFTIVSSVTMITQFLTVQSWGRLSDQFGNKKVLNVCGFGVSLVPLLWMVSGNFYYLIAVQTVSGIVWAGHALGTSNFIFDSVPRTRLAASTAYQAFMNTIFMCAGSLLGGYIATALENPVTIFGGDWKPASPFPVIFFLSALLRLHGAWTFLPRFKEVREVKHIRHRDLIMEITQVGALLEGTYAVFGMFWPKGAKHRAPGNLKSAGSRR